MATKLDVTIYYTKELADYCDETYDDENRAGHRAYTWINGTFTNTSGWDVSTTLANATPDPKYEGPAGQFFCECRPSGHSCWTSLWDWFNNWVNASCNDLARSVDANILLTANGTGNGLGGGNAAIYCDGQSIAELPSSYSEFGYQSEHSAMAGVLEELGH